jgi:parvulin-like peptidyl-prolyl isomerase
VLAVAFVLTACSGNGPATAATVNGQKISQSELERGVKGFVSSKVFRDQFNAQLSSSPDSVKMDPKSSTTPASFNRQWLTSLMQAAAIEQLAAKKNVKATPQDVQQVESELAQSQSAPVLQSLPAWLRNQIVKTTALQVALRNSLPAPTVSADQLRTAYQQLSADCASKRLVAHILVKDEQQAKDVVSQLDKGDSFANVASQVSIDTGSKSQGGILMCEKSSQWSQLDQTFAAAAEATKTGTVSKPVQTQFGWHVIKVLDLTPENAQPYLLATQQANLPDPLSAVVLKYLKNSKLWVNPRYGKVDRSADGAFQISSAAVTPKSRPTDTPSTTVPSAVSGGATSGAPQGQSTPPTSTP